ncbi:uncharacterized protein BDR25DRAFT_349306 [Lindgomyces ingoldianus]|uniref:Uncharacterized protein n=1 Tax=Lindgomyces ingoldianus TaxID=673940 RepID=A0ACB6RCI7_9PLEO|nr:uncharacterized protein BDR25DRAFT_349306 [Lindgomyces ingoldianus]KAF2476181.1 hypothetical protein BDR25DRAFT_349306 [Lindgomyces ingoldianus]
MTEPSGMFWPKTLFAETWKEDDITIILVRSDKVTLLSKRVEGSLYIHRASEHTISRSWAADQAPSPSQGSQYTRQLLGLGTTRKYRRPPKLRKDNKIPSILELLSSRLETRSSGHCANHFRNRYSLIKCHHYRIQHLLQLPVSPGSCILIASLNTAPGRGVEILPRITSVAIPARSTSVAAIMLASWSTAKFSDMPSRENGDYLNIQNFRRTPIDQFIPGLLPTLFNRQFLRCFLKAGSLPRDQKRSISHPYYSSVLYCRKLISNGQRAMFVSGPKKHQGKYLWIALT